MANIESKSAPTSSGIRSASIDEPLKRPLLSSSSALGIPRKNSSDKQRSTAKSSRVPVGGAAASTTTLWEWIQEGFRMLFSCLVGTAVHAWARGSDLMYNQAPQRVKSRSSETHIYKPVSLQEPGGGEMQVLEDEFGDMRVEFSSPLHHDEFPVLVEEESDNSVPRLLTPDMMRQLLQKGLPSILETKHWKRLYSLRRDGDSFLTFVNNVAKHKYTLLVVKTMDDDLLGAFVDTEWQRGHGGVEGHQQFYGTGQSFLFKVEQPGNIVHVYKWTGLNNYNQLCLVDTTMIALGGGGKTADFGLCIQDSFTRGSSGRCDTFGNPPLASRELFEILRFEVYGFVNHQY